MEGLHFLHQKTYLSNYRLSRSLGNLLPIKQFTSETIFQVVLLLVQLWVSPVALNVSPEGYYLHKPPTQGRKASFCQLIFALLPVSAGIDRIEAS